MSYFAKLYLESDDCCDVKRFEGRAEYVLAKGIRFIQTQEGKSGISFAKKVCSYVAKDFYELDKQMNEAIQKAKEDFLNKK